MDNGEERNTRSLVRSVTSLYEGVRTRVRVNFGKLIWEELCFRKMIGIIMWKGIQ